MSGSTTERLEHAEHTVHAAHQGGFQAQVALTMAIVAALLAVVHMLSHRSHNEHLVLQTEATRLETQANILHTRASDTWAFFQAKKTREAELKTWLAVLPLLSREPGFDEAAKLTAEWRAHVAQYASETPGELPELKRKAEELTRAAEEKSEKSLAKIEESELVHLRSNRYDLAELGAEIALVLCSISLLTKRRTFWLAAIVFALAGVAGAATAFQGIALGQSPGAAEGH